MTTVYLAPTFGVGYQAFSNGGLPLNLGQIYTYQAGGTTPQATYTTSAGNVQNANPIVLDAAGRTPNEVWLLASTSYRFDLYDSLGNLIKTFDNITASADASALSGSGGAALVGNNPAGNISATTVQAAVNELDTEKLAKAGDTATGTMTFTGSTLDNQLLAALVLSNSTSSSFGMNVKSVNPQIGLIMTTNPGTTTPEASFYPAGYDDAGTFKKIASISFKWASPTAASTKGLARHNATYTTGGVNTDDVFMRGFGNEGVDFFGSSDTTGPGSKVLRCNGTFQVNRAVAEAGALAQFTGTPGLSVEFDAAGGGGYSGAATVMYIGRNVGTSRSINAGGTVNASGADYAEYMRKAMDCGTIAKGQIVGITAKGEITDKWDEAVTFMVKSTNPSYVGGDVWGNDESIGPRPAEPKLIVPEPPAGDDPLAMADYQARNEVAKQIFDSATYPAYLSELETWQDKLDHARQFVDRIAFAGQVPVNVHGAQPGDWIIPTQCANTITGFPVKHPSFEQYMTAVGQVIAIEDDGRARIIVRAA